MKSEEILPAENEILMLKECCEQLIIENQSLKHSIELNQGKDCIISSEQAIDKLRRDVEQFPNYLENKYGSYIWSSKVPNLDTLLCYDNPEKYREVVYKVLGYPSMSLFSKHKELFDKKHSKDYFKLQNNE